ncbi:parallel beta helix pectate lyase-like protein [Microbacterium sp. AG1240]|nr:parallel beta helix pectate lyase-like protein [Microbacterium sp. AG1240]
MFDRPIRRLSAFLLAFLFAVTGVLISSPVTPAQAATTVSPAGTYEDSSPNIVYTGTWSKLTSSGSSGGSIRHTSSTTASATLTFTGASITWYTWNSPTAGIVNVIVDGKTVATVDNYAPSSVTGVVGYQADVGPGTHTIKIVGSGQKNAKSSSRITHMDSFVVGEVRSVPSLDTPGRIAECPDATTTVSTPAELTAALGSAQPGSVIRLNDGVYTGEFTLQVFGTADQPVWLCGGRGAVLQTGSVNTGLALRVHFSTFVHVAGFSVNTSLQGVMVKNSRDVTVSDLAVSNIGYEGIHLYSQTTDSAVQYNVISRTGVRDVAYGEGVYIGTSQRRWSEVTAGQPDKSDRNKIIMNTISDTGAEHIEAKEGTTGGIIGGNTLTGSLPGSRSLGWVLVTGNDWTVAYNDGSDAVEHAYSSMVWSNWGYDNEFFANTGTANSSGYGVWVHDKNRRVKVACDNDITSSGSGLTNVFCSP